MKPWKLSDTEQRVSRNSRASWSGFQAGPQTQQVSGRRQTGLEHQLRCKRQVSRGQGLKILAREEILISAEYNWPNTRTVWLRDCSTPQAALVGTFVSASALVFLRKMSVQFSDPNCHRVTALIPVAHTRSGSAEPGRN